MKGWLMSIFGYVTGRRDETQPEEKDRRERELTLLAVEGTQHKLHERLDRLDREQRAEYELLTGHHQRETFRS